jgi:hypothetical protein
LSQKARFQRLLRMLPMLRADRAVTFFGGAYSMNRPYGSGASGPDAAFTAAAEGFFQLLKAFGVPAAGSPGRAPDWSSLAGPLAGQFEQWLRMSQAAGPWFGRAAAPGWPFGPLPLGPGAAPTGEGQRTFELLGRLAQLQGQLGAHWSEIAQTAARNFIARMGSAASAPAADNALKLYELWVDCAEEAYATTVRKEDFCHLQAELANTSAALLVEQRRHAETLVRAFGLPTRNEMDALYEQLKELRGQVAQLAQTPRAAAPRAANSRPPRVKDAARGPRRPARGGRARPRRPRT